jgi:hypothetical protein
MANTTSTTSTEVARMSAERDEVETAPLPVQDILIPVQPPAMEFMAGLPEVVEAAGSANQESLIICRAI